MSKWGGRNPYPFFHFSFVFFLFTFHIPSFCIGIGIIWSGTGYFVYLFLISKVANNNLFNKNAKMLRRSHARTVF